MARKIINIGAIGNDGTGDSIRDSFRSVNDNFRELYSSLGLGDKLTFIGLDDTPLSYPSDYENAVVVINATTDGVVFKKLQNGTGIQLDFDTSDNSIVINSLFSDISGDPTPNLGGPLNAQSGGIRYPIGNLPDIGSFSELTSSISKINTIHGSTATETNRLAANKGYADSKISLAGIDAVDPATNTTNTSFGTMTGPLILSRDPVDADDQAYNGLIAATKRYVDSSGYSSTVNLYVSTVGSDDRAGVGLDRQGRSLAYAYKTLEGALKRAEELLLEAPLEIGPYKKVLTWGNGDEACTLAEVDDTSATTGAGFSAQFIYMNVDTVEISAQGANYLPGDVLTVVSGTGTAARYEVLSVGAGGAGGRGPVTAVRQLTAGSYTSLPTPALSAATSCPGSSVGIREGCTLNLTFKVARVQIATAGRGSGYGLVSVRFLGGGGAGAFGVADVDAVDGGINSISITSGGGGFTSLPNVVVSLPRFRIYTSGYRTDFTGNPELSSVAANSAKDIREGLYLRGETSGALAQILAHNGTLDSLGNEEFDVDVISGEFEVGETISFGDVTKRIQISVFVETGIYEENYPLRVPQNVAVIGDEFRRTIIRPKIGYDSSSPWAFINFRRDPIIDGLTVTTQLYGYHYLTDSTQPVYPLIANKGNYKSAAQLLTLNRAFIQSQVIGWINRQILTSTAPFTSSFDYNQDLCYRDVGLIIDSMVFDLKWGGQNRTISAALKYKGPVTAFGDPALAIGAQLSQTVAGIERIDTLAQDVINNVSVATLYTLSGVAATTSTLPTPQILDEGIVAESGSGTVITLLTDAIVDVISNSGTVNYPKDNGDMDVFLCNDAVILRAMTYQGHGGFSMVLDPEGQILAKSPYCQESASFSRSVNTKTFAGGMFVDGFTGNQKFVIDSKDSNTIIRVSGLLRPPSTPCSFIVNDEIYRINYIRSYSFGTGSPTATTGGYSTAQFILDELTPYTTAAGSTICTFSSSPIIATATDNGLQPGAIVKFSSTGVLPTGISANTEYYVLLTGFTTTTFRITATSGSTTPVTYTGTGSGVHSFLRIFEVLMPGNRSMLSNDFTQVADLGYGLLVTNGGLTEAVSMFTYYCQVSYYSLNGGQIRSVGGSSAHGNFALVAEGSDPLEVPTPTGFYTDLAQTATVYAATVSTVNEKAKNIIYLIYSDFFPLPGSELEINHGGNIARYAVSTTIIDDLATKRVKVNISTGGGLISAVPHGQPVTIRNNSFHVVYGDVVNVATRPSTALVLNDSNFVYRVLEFDAYDSTYDKETYTITNINYATGVITTNIDHRQRVGYTVRFIKPGGAVLPNEITAGVSVEDGSVYYVKTVPASNQFTISTSKIGAGLTFTGTATSGSPTVSPYALAVAQLRENYDYVEITVYDPAVETGAANSITSVSTAGNTFTKNAHGLKAGQPIRFSATSLPGGLTVNTVYFVATSGLTANDFSVTDQALIDSTLIGVPTSLSIAVGPTLGASSGAGPYFVTISNITCIDTFDLGMSVIKKPDITSVTVAGNGTTCTYTFTAQNVPPYLPFQNITISAFVTVGYNGTFSVISCTNTTVTVTNATTGGTTTGGTIAVVSTGALGTASTIYSISTATNSIVVQSSSAASAGSIAFQVEGPVIDITTTGTTVSYKLVQGERGDSTFGVGNLGGADGDRIANGIAAGTYYKFVHEGTEYSITNYQDSDTTGQDYALLTVSPSLARSVIRYNDPPTLKGSVASPSELSDGTLTIRISLTRVTSHDLLEIGTGGYADTNYPSEIYGPPVNSITSVPTYATQADVGTGELVLRAQMQERGSGRTFFVTTDQFGNFNVGPFFRVDQGTGTVTFSASIALSQLDGLGFKRGTTISEFSTSMDEGRVDAVPTEAAIRTYVGRRLGLDYQGNVIASGERVPAGVGFMALSGDLSWIGPSPMDMNDFKIINVKIPTASSDAARLDSITITNLKDTDGTNLFNFSQPQAGQLLTLDGAGNTIVNATPTGEVTFDIQAGDSTTSVIRTTVSDGVIDNANIMSTAAIDQTKLSLNNSYATISSSITNVTATGSGSTATITFPVAQSSAPFVAGQKIVVSGLSVTGYNGTYTVATCNTTVVTYSNTTTGSAISGTVSALRGISSFDSVQFTLTNGWATIKDNGLALSKLVQVGADKLLGNSGASAANVAEVDFTTVVDEGRALRLSDYGSASSTGYLRHTGGDGSSRAGWTYSIVDEATAATASTLVKRDSNGDFSARNVDLSQLKIDSILTIDSNTSGTGGFMQYYGFSGTAGIYMGDGSVGTDKITYYNNNKHVLRSQDSGTTYATIDSNGISVSSLKNCTSISSGGVTTPGTITGYWSLDSTSRFQATYAADLAEYYEGDKEYAVGTVLIFGGDKEVTIANKKGDHRVAGVVSDNAAYSMNGDCPGFKNQVALQGRVPCRVVGKIEKGDLLIASNIAGCAVSAGGDAKTGTVIGKALENYDSDHIGTIEVAVGRN